MSNARKLIISIIAIIVLGIAAVATYIIYQNNNAPEALSVDTAAASDTFDPATLTGTWNVTTNSVAGYRVDEVLSGQDVTVVGRTKDITGTVDVKDSQLEKAELTVNLDSVATDSSKRDGAFRDLLKTSEHPNAQFVVDSAVALTNGVAGENNSVSFEVPGKLTVSGQTADVTAKIAATSVGATTKLVGTIPVKFADYGIEAPDMGFVKVEKEGLVEFSLELAKK